MILTGNTTDDFTSVLNKLEQWEITSFLICPVKHTFRKI